MTQLDKIEVLLEMISEDIKALKKRRSLDADHALLQQLDKIANIANESTCDLEFQEIVLSEFTKTQKILMEFQPHENDSVPLPKKSIREFLINVFWPIKNLTVTVCLSIIMFLLGSLCMYLVR